MRGRFTVWAMQAAAAIVMVSAFRTTGLQSDLRASTALILFAISLVMNELAAWRRL